MRLRKWYIFSAMDVGRFIEEIKRRKDLREVVHHKEVAPLPPSFGEAGLSDAVKKALGGLGIERLYGHQSEGLDLVRHGRNVVVMTPAASGKSLIYNVPVVESLMADPASKALYIFPLKGLEQDQLRAFKELTKDLPIEREAPPPGKRGFFPGLSEIYDGDTPDSRRRKIREKPPAVILTNPDMLHLAINPYHEKWEGFLRDLKYVIIDEVHAYRGVFGSHVAHVLRRFRRVLDIYGSRPVFIASSATIANPVELVERLTGLPFELIEKSGAPVGKRNFLFINPLPGTSPYTLGTRLFIASVRAGFKTIAFTKARKITELMHTWVMEGAPELSRAISSYRAGFLPEERREIERKLFGGELSGVISTSALELGVDVGGLDVCILVGYPGTISSTLQRGGRVGRAGKDSLIILIALQDALDQYFMRSPRDFFRRPVEAAVIDHENPFILKSHLLCSASETLYLKPGDPVYDMEKYRPLLEELEAEGKLSRWEKGGLSRWYSRTRYPHRDISIREVGEPFLIIDEEEGTVVGESSSTRVLYELHPGAVYLHRGVHYRVTRLDLPGKKVFIEPSEDIDYYTTARTDEETRVMSLDDRKELRNFTINQGTLRVTETVLGFRKKHIFTGEVLGEEALRLPPSVFSTKGIWMEVDETLTEEVRRRRFSVPGSLHALEHAAIAALPLYALCDRMDLGGVSYPFNPELKAPAIFIYDGHEGGVGLTRRGFDCVLDWFASTLKLMEECGCEVSCPSCCQDPKCGSGNEPLDKRGAVMILERWLGLWPNLTQGPFSERGPKSS